MTTERQDTAISSEDDKADIQQEVKLEVPDAKETSKDEPGVRSFADRWSSTIKASHTPIIRVLVAISRFSAMNPKRTLTGIITFSLGAVVIGMATNFTIEVDEDALWSPIGSKPVQHNDWINDESGFPPAARPFALTIHSHGANVLGMDGVFRVFEALNTIRDTPGYDDICQGGRVDLGDGNNTCRMSSPTTFWDHSVELFQDAILTDEDAIAALSQSLYPDSSPVDHASILGSPIFDDNGILVEAALYMVRIDLPSDDEYNDAAIDFEEIALENLERLHNQWASDASVPFQLEYFAERSFSDEFGRAIIRDIPLVPIVFVIMSIFTSLVFFQRDKVQSRSAMGFGAICCVFLAILAGYGLLFICGVPLTSMTQILPFIMFGIGLDAAFILSGSFLRTDIKKDIVERIEETVEDVGMSITLTTLTSATAFALGCISSIPAVIWLCLYAFPTILFSSFFQFTFFVAVMTLDERRVLENRRDCLCCVTAKVDVVDGDQEEETENAASAVEQTVSMSDRFMLWYADKILTNNSIRAIVILAFVGLLVGCCYSASKLEQHFEYTEVIPSDSYIGPYFDSLSEFTSRGGALSDVYFRNEDQSSPEVQQQMEDYVNALVDLKQVDYQPSFFWVRDFNTYVEVNAELANMTFTEQFDIFINDPVYADIYGDNVVLDNDGNIIASRTTVYFNNVDDKKVLELIEALEDQRDVTTDQSINDGKGDWSFFTYSQFYLIWEFYSVAVNELILSTVLGVGSVTVLSVVFMPHWTAVFFVLPLICVLYMDLLGVLQLAGLAINPVSYVGLVMSIGLLVDFIVHVLLRYYEVEGTRFERTKEMLRTMGSSVMLGGISTFLGVIPLAFSTSSAFFTIFVSFMGLVSLGIGHGLILLPVLLSIFGPES